MRTGDKVQIKGITGTFIIEDVSSTPPMYWVNGKWRREDELAPVLPLETSLLLGEEESVD
jgi:hypothetical protein